MNDYDLCNSGCIVSTSDQWEGDWLIKIVIPILLLLFWWVINQIREALISWRYTFKMVVKKNKDSTDSCYAHSVSDFSWRTVHGHKAFKVFFLFFFKPFREHQQVREKLSRLPKKKKKNATKSETTRKAELEISIHAPFLLSLAYTSRRRLKHYFVPLVVPCCNPANTAKPFTKKYMEDTKIQRRSLPHPVYLVCLIRFFILSTITLDVSVITFFWLCWQTVPSCFQQTKSMAMHAWGCRRTAGNIFENTKPASLWKQSNQLKIEVRVI